jgi:nanoRNase/pAp phosphatase (c-di-AMP/oligoRNAs hydrolase)
MRTKRTEAKLLGYNLFYDRTGKLLTERTSTDISALKKFLSAEEFNTLTVVLREATTKLDTIHNEIEAHLNARLLTN